MKNITGPDTYIVSRGPPSFLQALLNPAQAPCSTQMNQHMQLNVSTVDDLFNS